MGGLKHLLFRLIPIITLICFICFGITYTFQQSNQNNITYLETHYYDKNNNYTEIIHPSQIQKESENTLITHEFNFKSYRENMNPQTLTEAFTNAIDTSTYMETIETFEQIWSDGYQLGELSQTIVNAIVVLLNTVSLIINLILIPVRLICGILLMGMSIIGINISANTPIITVLDTLKKVLAIPMIQPWTT